MAKLSKEANKALKLKDQISNELQRVQYLLYEEGDGLEEWEITMLESFELRLKKIKSLTSGQIDKLEEMEEKYA